MFDFLFKKEFLSCEWLESGIHMNHAGVSNCPFYFHSDKNDTAVSPLTPLGEYDFDDFFKKKREMIKSHKSGIVCERCLGCFNLKKTLATRKKFVFKNIAVSANTNCNSDCIYCYTHADKNLYNNMPNIPILGIFQKFYKNKMIDENTKIEFGGGEPTLHPDFNSVINLILTKPFKEILIYSSGIKYDKCISDILNTEKGNLIISVDSGCPDTYKKIKNVDEFHSVFENIKKYANSQNNFPYQVKVKFIFLENINDNKEEIDMFIEKILNSDVKFVMFELEMNWYKTNKNNKEKLTQILNLIDYFKVQTKEKGIIIGYGAQFNCLQNKNE